MAYQAEQRKYQRCNSIICKALMSTDSMRWENMDVVDISAGGLRFTSCKNFNLQSELCFNIYVYNMLAEFNLRLDGRIVRIDRNRDNTTYAVKFINVNKYYQVQLDELIKSKITVVSTPQAAPHDDEICTLLLIPRLKPEKMRIRMMRR